ncbi:MAG: ABC transporter permease [Ruminococcus sp.]|nr:ABC transporter permease [Ruminococcus sp.]
MIFLFKKMIRSVKQFKLQFTCVLLLAMLSVIIYSGLEGIWRGIDYGFDSYTKETNLADEWVYATYLTDDDAAKIKEMKGVTEVSKRLRITASSHNDENDTYLSLDTVGSEGISQMKLISGEKYDRSLKNSIWLDADYANENDITTGQTIDITFGGKTIHPSVTGLVMSAEKAHYVGTNDYYIPEHKQYGYGFISDDIRKQLAIGIECNLLEIKSSDSAVKESINELLGKRFIAYYDRDTLFDVAFVSGQAENLKRVSMLFSSLFILLSVLSMRTTIKRLIDAQSADITTLKSLGFSRAKLTIYYSLYGLMVGVIGTGLGYVFSFPFSAAIRKSQKALISLPKWETKHTAGSLIVILLIIALSLIASVLAARKALIGLPAESVQSNVKRTKTTLLERIRHIWNRTGFGMKWTLRDASIHKSRIALGIISVCGSFMLLMIGTGTPDSVKALTSKSYSEEFVYSYKLTLDQSNTPEQTASLTEQLDGQLIQTVQSRITTDDSETCFKPVTIFSSGDYLALKTIDGDKLDKDSVYITQGMAETLNLDKGDAVKLSPSFSDHSFEFTIDGIIASGMPQTFYIGSHRWVDAGAVFQPTHLLCGEINDISSISDDPRISQVMTAKQQRSNLEEFQKKLTGVFTLMKVVAFVLVVIVLYNLSILSFLERTKEYNTFRVLGFHFSEIRKLASFENIIILVMGTLLGLPLGSKFLEIYCATFSNDTIKIYSALKSISLVIVCLTVVICTVITTVLLSRRIKKIDMVQALKE